MCVGKCTRILGPCLIALGVLSIAANVLLLFPSWTWSYVKEGRITKQAMQVPGVWGGGIIVLLAATQITAVGWHCGRSSDCGTCRNMFLSIVLSGLALLGSTACFILSGVGLTNGPLCLYNQTEVLQWDYPFVNMENQAFHTRAQNYLYDPSLWNSVCIEPPNVVAWNIYFFSVLLVISVVEMVLASLQVINGFFGCLCGLCEGK
ncbi:transmembrane 4 L6 family member 19 isoform X1 [Gopherus evgoodei]|uniref:transmembrane 4 L6 family member 19 isoform X1 n=1 Tax=Gopherus evgoodei TaxID=1825980 RepID=UPI0011CF39EA|nr:transmembrane 4 L6 family member 19 isoform X1 [Gopherus evgoodei]